MTFSGALGAFIQWSALAMLCATGATAQPVAADMEPSPVVIELFTSQGCSACPAADALLARLARRDDVLALALHVDYWDYIGWPDTFAQPQFTQRQKAYARAAGLRTIYTPQMVIAGVDHVIGSKAMDVMEYVEMRRSAPARAHLSGAVENGMMRLHLAPAGDSGANPLPEDLSIMAARFLEEAAVDIRRGENAGRTLTYTNIVTDLREIGRWDGRAPLDLAISAPRDGALAVFVQEPGPGEIIAARRLR